MTRARAVSIVVTLLTAGIACSPSSSPSSTEEGALDAYGSGESDGGGDAQAPRGDDAPGRGRSDAQAGRGGATAGDSGSMDGGGAAMGDAGVNGSRDGGTTASTADAGSGGAGSTGTDGSIEVDEVKSAGCGRARTLQNGALNISFAGASRRYILRVPDSYDSNRAYRLVFAFAESGASAMSVASRNYFTLATLDGKNTIFVAPDAANGAGSWSKSDVELTDAILAQIESDLCIDKSRIFATGFSFGGAMSLALACTRADVFRGVAFFSGADLTGSCSAPPTKPIAYYASQASQDSTGAPMPSSGRVKQAQFAMVNGCAAEPSATTFPADGQPHTCTEYKGCSPGHPTKYCVFAGAHGWEPKDPGQTTSWNPPEAWKFITQF